jgi:hypothetical protein
VSSAHYFIATYLGWTLFFFLLTIVSFAAGLGALWLVRPCVAFWRPVVAKVQRRRMARFDDGRWDGEEKGRIA